MCFHYDTDPGVELKNIQIFHFKFPLNKKGCHCYNENTL